MQCLHPLNIPNPKFGKRPGEFRRLIVPCGKCVACLNNKANKWAFRLEQELKISTNAIFLTLTYDNDYLYYNNNNIASVCRTDVQQFLKRLRHKSSQKIKYMCVAEYGDDSYRPHYHAILFNLVPIYNETIDEATAIYNACLKSWNKGNIYIGSVTSASIRYVTKYALKGSEKLENQDDVFRLMSKGLGANYIQNKAKWHHDDITRNYAVKEGGIKVALPRYYKDKIYTEHEKLQQAEFIGDIMESRYEEEKSKFLDKYPDKTLKDFDELFYVEKDKKLKRQQQQKKQKI